MILYHATPSVNDASIELRGLLTAFSTTARQEIWLHDLENRHWAKEHVAKRHGCKIGDVTFYKVTISGSKLRKRGRGMYTTTADIPPLSIEVSRFKFPTIRGQ